jgi:hypothetical protein
VRSNACKILRTPGSFADAKTAKCRITRICSTGVHLFWNWLGCPNILHHAINEMRESRNSDQVFSQALRAGKTAEGEPCDAALYTDGTMKIFTFESKLYLPVSIDTVFPFFAEARNLELLTPPFLHFNIITLSPIVMARGARIQYRLKLRGIPITWETMPCGAARS